MPFGELHFKYETVGAEHPEIEREFRRDLDAVLGRLGTLRRLAEAFNGDLRALIRSELQKRRDKVSKDAAVSAALSIPLQPRDGAPKPFSIPVREKIKLVRVGRAKRPAQQWVLEDRNYELILGVLRDLGESMQRTPSAFADMEEEHLRDIILFVLNGHFRGKATGETFNGAGKSDILMRWRGRNAFIAECKFWEGRKGLLAAIKQVGTYTCWSDTKATLLMITRRTRMSTVLGQTRATLAAHPKAKGKLEERDRNEFRLELEHPTDKGTRLALTVLVYNVRRLKPPPRR